MYKLSKASQDFLRGCNGQATLEFALVCMAFMGIVFTLSVLWKVLQGGLFVDHALSSASHHLQSISAGVIGDVFLY